MHSIILTPILILGTSTLPLIDFSSDLLFDVKKRVDVTRLLSAEEQRRQHNTNSTTFFSKGRPQKHYMNIDFWSSNELVNPLLFLADLGRCGDFVGCTSLAVRKACAVLHVLIDALSCELRVICSASSAEVSFEWDGFGMRMILIFVYHPSSASSAILFFSSSDSSRSSSLVPPVALSACSS